MTGTLNATINRLLEKADHIIYVDALTMYLGFCDRGTTLTSESTWTICKIVSSGSVFPYTQSVLWANGTHNFDLVMDNYASYTYKFKNFD